MTSVALESPSRRAGAGRRVDIAVCAVLFAAVLAAEAVYAFVLDGHHIFIQWDVMFDTDPRTYRLSMAHGWSEYSMRHPLVSYFFSVPFRLLSQVAALAGLTDDPEAFRETAALLVAPVCAAAKTACFFCIFRLLGLSRFKTIVATSATCLAFSSIVFGAIPDTYAVSGAALAAVTLAAVASVRLRDRLGRLAPVLSVAAGVFAVGTTSSNVIHVGWIGVARRSCDGISLRNAFLGAVLTSALLLSVVGMVGKTVNTLQMHPQEFGTDVLSFLESKDAGFVGRFYQSARHTVITAVRAPEYIARTFLPTRPGVTENVWGIEYNQQIQDQFSYNVTPFGPAAALLWAIGLVSMVGGAIIAWRFGGLWRAFGLASAATIPSLFLVYAGFGWNTYLFSQLWHVPAAILLAAWLTRPWTETRWFPFAAVAALAAWAAADLYTVAGIDQQIALWIEEAQTRPVLF